MAEVSELEKRLADLAGELASLKHESKTNRLKYKKAREERQAAEQERDAAKAELEKLRTTKTATPEETLKELASLKGEIKARKYLDAFTSIAKQSGLREDALNAAYRLADLDTSADEPEAESINAKIEELRSSSSFLFGEKPETASGEAKKPEKKPLTVAVSTGKGQSDTSQRPFKVTQGDLMNPSYMRKWAKEISAANADGRLIVED